jgi:hypothetical protein
MFKRQLFFSLVCFIVIGIIYSSFITRCIFKETNKIEHLTFDEVLSKRFCKAAHTKYVGGECVVTECPDEDCWTLTHTGSNRYKHILQTKPMDLKTLDDGETGCVTKNPQKCGINIAKPTCLPFDCYDWNTNPSTNEHTQTVRKFHDTNTLYDAGGGCPNRHDDDILATCPIREDVCPQITETCYILSEGGTASVEGDWTTHTVHKKRLESNSTCSSVIQRTEGGQFESKPLLCMSGADKIINARDARDAVDAAAREAAAVREAVDVVRVEAAAVRTQAEVAAEAVRAEAAAAVCKIVENSSECPKEGDLGYNYVMDPSNHIGCINGRRCLPRIVIGHYGGLFCVVHFDFTTPTPGKNISTGKTHTIETYNRNPEINGRLSQVHNKGLVWEARNTKTQYSSNLPNFSVYGLESELKSIVDSWTVEIRLKYDVDISAYNLFEITTQTNDSTFLHIPSLNGYGLIGSLPYSNKEMYRNDYYASYTGLNTHKQQFKTDPSSFTHFIVDSVYGSANQGYDHVIYYSINGNQTGTNLLANQGRCTLYYDKVKIYDHDLSDVASYPNTITTGDSINIVIGCIMEKHSEIAIQKIKIYSSVLSLDVLPTYTMSVPRNTNTAAVVAAMENARLSVCQLDETVKDNEGEKDASLTDFTKVCASERRGQNGSFSEANWNSDKVKLCYNLCKEQNRHGFTDQLIIQDTDVDCSCRNIKTHVIGSPGWVMPTRGGPGWAEYEKLYPETRNIHLWLSQSLANSSIDLVELHNAMRLYKVPIVADERKNYCMLRVKMQNCYSGFYSDRNECTECQAEFAKVRDFKRFKNHPKPSLYNPTSS